MHHFGTPYIYTRETEAICEWMISFTEGEREGVE